MRIPPAILTLALLAFAMPLRAEIVLPAAPAPLPGTPGTPAAPGAVAPLAPAAPTFGDRLLFADKDTLRGNLVSFSGAALVWRHKDGFAPFEFKTDRLDRIDLSSFAPKADPKADMRLVLGNGDTVCGQLVEYAPDKVVLDTWYAGRITLLPAWVVSMTPSKNASDALVSGVGKVADWRVSNGGPASVKIEGDHMTLMGSVCVAREVDKLPAKYRIDIEMGDRQPQFQFAFLSDTTQTWGGNSYTLQTNGQRSLYLQKCTRQPNGGSRSEGSNSWNFHAAEESFTLSVLVDMDARNMVFLANGQQVGSTSIPADFTPGKNIVMMGQNGGLKITKFMVVPWSGVVEVAGAAIKRGQTDTLVMTNKDKVSGALLAVKDGKASFQAEFAKMDIPLDRIQRIELSGKGAKAQKQVNGDAYVFFNDTEHLTLAVSAIKDGKLTGQSESLGALSVELPAVKRIEFNLEASFRKELAAKAKQNPGEDE